MIKWTFILLLSNLFGDTIVYNHYPPKLFWKPKPKPTIKVLEDVEFRGITDNFLIYHKNWGVFGNRLYQIPCNDVIDAKDTSGYLIQYKCNENTFDSALYTRNEIVHSSTRNARFNGSFGFLNDRMLGSFLGFSYDIMQSRTDELFLGHGFFIPPHLMTSSLGWKHYFSKSKSSFYSIVAIQNLRILSLGSAFIPTVALGYEVETSSKYLLQFGGFIHPQFEKGFIPYLKMDFP
tara:strand:+ start:380 stop:1081 length:702 start_codon:yes stop_codon:yes gene_type:complete